MHRKKGTQEAMIPSKEKKKCMGDSEDNRVMKETNGTTLQRWREIGNDRTVRIETGARRKEETTEGRG